MYYILQSSVYFHGCNGPYETIEDAKKEFNKAYEEAKVSRKNWRAFDGHHMFHIVKELPKLPFQLHEQEQIETIEFEPLHKILGDY